MPTEQAELTSKVEDTIRPSYMAHFVLHTNRRDELVDWYKKLLGAWVQFENQRLTFLTFDREHHRLVIIQHGDLIAPDPQSWGVVHLAYSFPSLEVLVADYKRLRDLGIMPNRSINHGPTTSFYYTDADGNNIEFQTDNFENFEATTEYMHGEDFAHNSRGVNFDPEWMVRELGRGVPAATLKIRPCMVKK